MTTLNNSSVLEESVTSVSDDDFKHDPGIMELIRKLKKLEVAVETGNKKKIKKISDWFHKDLVGNKKLLSELYKNQNLRKKYFEVLGSEGLTQNDLILTACKTKRTDILFYILNETDILVHLTDGSFDQTIINKQRIEAFKTVMQSSEDHTYLMVEIMYDHWCGNLHSIGYDLNNIKMVGKLLLEACNGLCVDNDELMIVHFHSLIKFNIFQQELYTELDKLNQNDETPEKTAKMLLKVLEIYHKHSEHHETEVYVEENERTMEDHAKAKTDFIRNFKNAIMTTYFRKLDINVSLLILENIYTVRKHLAQRFNQTEKYFKDNPDLEKEYRVAANSYKEFESELYHFIHRTSENWCMYSLNDDSNDYKIIRKNTMITVRYLERETFRNRLKKFEDILQKYCIKPALIGSRTQSQSKNKKNKKIVLLDENYLQPIEHMRDHYSLTKVVKYIEAVQKTEDMNFIIMERVLQVIGEMFKSTEKSFHLSQSTQALLQIAISVKTVRHLHYIRNFLSKAKGGQLGTRIDIENTKDQKLYDKIKDELEIIKQYINSVINIHNFILDKSLFEKNYKTLEKRDIPKEVQQRTGQLFQCQEDIQWIEENKIKMLLNVQSVKTHLLDYIVFVLPTFLENIKTMLKLIKNNKTNVNKINKQLAKYAELPKISVCPNDNELNRMQNEVLEWKNKNKSFQINTDALSKIKNYQFEWDSIKRMLAFCIRECQLITQIDFYLNEDSLPKNRIVRKVNRMVKELKDICATRRANFSRSQINYYEKRSPLFKSINFEGIENMVGYLKDKKQDDPRIAREELFVRLIERLNLLKQILLYPQLSVNQLFRRFNHDLEFRMNLEMILADIANVLVECEIRVMNKSSKLLRGIDLGNVLDHGNPFLDVISIDLKSHDFAGELVEKAMMFAKDANLIEAIYKLFKGKVDYATIIQDNSLKIQSENFEYYAKLTQYKIPKK